jgi:hypothetical protein
MATFTHFHGPTLKIRFLCMRTLASELQRDSCGRRVVRHCYALLTFLRRDKAPRRAAPLRPFASSPLMGKNAPAVKHYKENVKISRKMRNLIKREKLSFE